MNSRVPGRRHEIGTTAAVGVVGVVTVAIYKTPTRSLKSPAARFHLRSIDVPGRFRHRRAAFLPSASVPGTIIGLGEFSSMIRFSSVASITSCLIKQLANGHQRRPARFQDVPRPLQRLRR